MTEATRRLRRAGIAGLATVATVGGVLIASGGTAFATLATTGNEVNASATPTLYQGQSGVATGDVQLAVLNQWNAGDTLKIQLEPNGAPNACTTNNASVSLVGTPTASVTAGPVTAAWGTTASTATDETTPAFTVTTGSSSTACTASGITDTITLTFNNNSSGATTTDAYTITVTGVKVNVGSAVPTGDVTAPVTASNGTVATKATGTDNVAAVANTKLAGGAIVAGAPGASVNIGDITATDVTAGTIASPLVFTVANGTWGATTNAKLTGPSGTTWTISGGSGPTVTATLNTGTIPTSSVNTYVLSGVPVTLGTAGQTASVTATGNGDSIGGSVNVAVAISSSRVGGTDRYSTAAQIFEAGPISNDTAVLASGAGFADALSANFLASELDTGILLTDPNTLSQAAAQEIISEDIDTVYIVGGTAAVSTAVENTLKSMHVSNDPNNGLINVIRIGGADRYATNNLVDLYFGVGGGSTTAVVATGAGFADALAVGPAVWEEEDPLILTDGTSLSSAAESTLVNLGIQNVIIVGGTAAVSTAVETAIKALPGVTVEVRIAGADRTQTAAEIAKWETTDTSANYAVTGYPGVAGLGFTWGTGNAQVEIARGDSYADALVAGPYAGDNNSVILLTSNPTTLGAGIPAFLGGNASHISVVEALGLTGAVSTSVLSNAITSAV